MACFTATPWQTLAGAQASDAVRSAAPPPVPSWQQVVRDSPYWVSRGVHGNLVTIRRWVLSGESYCEDENRHIFFDRRAAFIGWFANEDGREATQGRINAVREQMAADGRVDAWAVGGNGATGYPFALSCNQPDARLADNVARYTGDDADARLWGTWDGMRVGEEDAPVSLHRAIREVYDYRREMGRVTLPETVLATLAGKVIIESGGQREALSAVSARGVMQLTPAALGDCEIPERFHLHRLAQIDCALYLVEQNHRNLQPAFDQRFGHLPDDKQEELYAMLLLQAYHGGIGRVIALLGDDTVDDDTLGGAARYFARHHAHYTAGDIALGMIFHNLGRNRLGFASLYYVTDVSIARDAACAALDDLPGCN